MTAIMVTWRVDDDPDPSEVLDAVRDLLGFGGDADDEETHRLTVRVDEYDPLSTLRSTLRGRMEQAGYACRDAVARGSADARIYHAKHDAVRDVLAFVEGLGL